MRLRYPRLANLIRRKELAMPARTPEELDALFADALNRADLPALLALYEPQASLTASPGKSVTGSAGIREALAGFLQARPKIELVPRVVAQTGDLALVTARWKLTMAGPDGAPAAPVAGQSVEVMRRQAEGHWLFAIDEPFGVGSQ
jgi:uncharacterized protein (TIGR02246 family)